MLKSMTGFGKASGTFQSKKISVEIRSLNSKSMDLNVRMPSLFKELDSAIRKFVSNELGRGKIDVFINLDSIGEESNVSINQGLAKKYFTELKALNDAVGTSTDDYLTLIMRMPDVIENAKEDLSEEEKQWLMALVKEAAQKLNEFRRKEGQDLEREFSERIDEIRGFLSEVHQYEDARIQTIRERMKKGLEDIDAGHDENRFEQEMIFYIEKLDISEEKMRL